MQRRTLQFNAGCFVFAFLEKLSFASPASHSFVSSLFSFKGTAARRIDAFLTSLQVSRRCPLRGWILSNQPLVGSSGLEPPTSRLSGVRSNHLSYEPISGGRPWPCHVSAYLCVRLSLSKHPMVEMNRIELSTPCLQGRCSPS